jgi:arylsulfatase A-like enzyme
LAGILWLAACTAPEQRPNLLLISVDTLRADALACYGGPPDVGTALCALADAGTRYVWAFSTAPTTSPSVASLLTSRWTPEHGVTQNLATHLADEHTTLAEVLRDGGYATAGIVSNPMLHASRRLQRGFEHFDQRMARRELNRPGFAERAAGDTTDAALDWVRDQAREPWFLWVHYQDPHGPYAPPHAADRPDPPGAAALPVLDDDSGRHGIPAYQALPGLRSRAAYEQRYHQEIRYLDGQVARLIHAIDALGERPGVLLTADHGEAFGEDDFYFAHGQSAGLEQIRVPLLWRPPPGGAGKGVLHGAVSLVDVAPTLLRAAGLEVPPRFVGRALQDPAASDRPLFAESKRQAAIVLGDAYYARDRKPGARSDMEGRPWDSGHPLLPPRSAQLGDAPALPAYSPAAAEPPLEPHLARFLAAQPARRAERHDEVPEELRQQLDALGYATP